jgi:hypothetical protein
MLHLRHALFVLGLLSVLPSLTGCYAYGRPGYGGRYHYEHRYYGRHW